jgi:hypothetical protein
MNSKAILYSNPISLRSFSASLIIFLLKFSAKAVSITKIGFVKIKYHKKLFLKRMIMQEILTAVTYPIVWLVCSYILKIESGLAKLLISLTAAILVYVLIGIKLSHRENEKDKED